MDKLTKYSFLKVDGKQVHIEVKNNEYSEKYNKNIRDKKGCAYIAENVYEDKIYCFVKYRAGFIFDPLRYDDTSYSNMEWKYKKVTMDVFFIYLKYLGVLKDFKRFKGKKYLLSQAEALLN